jgi:hypothetical protein
MRAVSTVGRRESYEWRPQPAAAAIVRELLEHFLARNSSARAFRDRLHAEAGTRLIDWLDYIVAPRSDAYPQGWQDAGFRPDEIDGVLCFVHDEGIFPVLIAGRDERMSVAMAVDSISDFAAVHGLQGVEGRPFDSYRLVRVSRENDAELIAVERHAYRGFNLQSGSALDVRALARHAEALRLRRRTFDDDAEGFDELDAIINAAIADLGRDRVCDLFFATEREFWQRRNHAGRVQFARQAALGLGWGNDDHHTYRSSRQWFGRLIEVFESLGLSCRERFYAGAESGWGAQVLEHPATGIVVFADVDLSPDEVSGDFSRGGLAQRDELGTVGMWCALHGESVLSAGMHHLECTFDHSLLRDQLGELGVGMMAPFTSLPYLRQSFTTGEVWSVPRERLARLVHERRISAAEADQFARFGAVGSHLENLERNDGYKGFNQTGVSSIIELTDPRRMIPS